MGQPGLPTRVLAARFGNRWTYAGDGVAPGQLRRAPAAASSGFRRIRPDDRALRRRRQPGRPFAVAGDAQRRLRGARASNAVYVPLEATDVDDFVAFAARLGLRGASVTAPFKVAR